MAQENLSTSLNSLKDSSFPTSNQNYSCWVAIKCQTETEGSHQLEPLNYNLPNKKYNNTRDSNTGGDIHGHHQTVSTKIRLVTFFAGEDGEALYSQ